MSRLPMTSMVWTFICSAFAIFALMGAELSENGAGIIEERRLVADGQDADLLGRKPEREIASVMFDEKADETFVGAERRAMDAERDLLGVIAVFVAKIEPARLGEIDLVGGDGELAADRAPGLHVDLRSVKRSFVRHFDEINSGILEDVSCHLFGLFPKLGLVDKFLSELARVVGRESHQILFDAEKLEVIQIHFVYGIELRLELLRRHIEMGVVHLHRAHAHKSKQLAALLVTMTESVLRQSQRQIAITPRQRRKHLMMMRAVHRL